MSSAIFHAALAGVFVSHALPSWPGVRERLRRRLGRAGYGALHAVLSTAALLFLIVAYRAQETRRMLFTPPEQAPALVAGAALAGFVLVALRLFVPPGDPTRPKPAAGVYRITRSPGAAGVLLWAAAHAAATGDDVRAPMFGVFALIAVFSIAKNHVVLNRADSAAARAFLQTTSPVPGLALLIGRQKFIAAEWSAPRPAAAVAAAVAAWAVFLVWGHPALFGVDPLTLLMNQRF